MFLKRDLFAIAPMVDVTDRYFRFLLRQMTKKATLYTEMINENAILKSRKGYEGIIGFHEDEHPVVCQIGGNDPDKAAEAAKIIE